MAHSGCARSHGDGAGVNLHFDDVRPEGLDMLAHSDTPVD